MCKGVKEFIDKNSYPDNEDIQKYLDILMFFDKNVV